MLTQRRIVSIPALDMWSRRRALYHPAFRVELIEHHNRTTEGVLIQHTAPHRRASGRSQLSIVLAGRALVRSHGKQHWLEPGDALVVDDVAGLVSRNEPDVAGNFVCLDIEWEPGTLGTRATGLAVERVGDTLPVAGLFDDAPAALSDLLARLRALGFGFERHEPGALVDHVPGMQALSSALDAALNEASTPTSIDLEARLGMTDRKIRRAVSALVERYRLRGGSNWREMRNQRINEAAFSMTAPGATTERVARAFGYAAPSALCLAFANLGLPSPGNVAAFVRTLGS